MPLEAEGCCGTAAVPPGAVCVDTSTCRRWAAGRGAQGLGAGRAVPGRFLQRGQMR